MGQDGTGWNGTDTRRDGTDTGQDGTGRDGTGWDGTGGTTGEGVHERHTTGRDCVTHDIPPSPVQEGKGRAEADTLPPAPEGEGQESG